tara:strand:+ start:671 stop:838 length:168 start_codon:yes stop_codon:yes gene_type:complete
MVLDKLDKKGVQKMMFYPDWLFIIEVIAKSTLYLGIGLGLTVHSLIRGIDWLQGT